MAGFQPCRRMDPDAPLVLAGILIIRRSGLRREGNFRWPLRLASRRVPENAGFHAISGARVFRFADGAVWVKIPPAARFTGRAASERHLPTGGWSCVHRRYR